MCAPPQLEDAGSKHFTATTGFSSLQLLAAALKVGGHRSRASVSGHIETAARQEWLRMEPILRENQKCGSYLCRSTEPAKRPQVIRLETVVELRRKATLRQADLLDMVLVGAMSLDCDWYWWRVVGGAGVSCQVLR